MEMTLTTCTILTGIVSLAVFRLPIELVLWGCVAVLVLAGVVSIDEALAGFGNSAVVTIACLYVLTAGLHQTGALDGLFRGLLEREHRLGRARFIVMAVAAVLSAFVNNTPVVALLIPLCKMGCGA